ncbi:hypothetical protein LJR219_002648 [Phenylobacterium sp. LjRoot219]|uniref:hypothetical protein n=1 Tax=Phenylobacterium sp. LjRoot219 TaxID=3342283 RepID=UPI003ECE5303
MRTLILTSVCAVGLCGCVQSIDAPLSPTFGQAVASMDTQIIPVRPSDQPPSANGARAASAIARLEKGEVYKPETANTSNVSVMSYGGK